MAYATAKSRVTGGPFGAPGEYVGYRVHDPEGREIGRAKELFVNDDAEPEYIRVSIGFLGLGAVLIPVQAVVVDEARRILTLH